MSGDLTDRNLAGIDAEGIYRKSGGSTQVKVIQSGFEKDLDYDISDPDLDIHAVTSTLKQYLRKLPTPLITFEVYDQLIEATRELPPPPPHLFQHIYLSSITTQ